MVLAIFEISWNEYTNVYPIGKFSTDTINIAGFLICDISTSTFFKTIQLKRTELTVMIEGRELSELARRVALGLRTENKISIHFIKPFKW